MRARVSLINSKSYFITKYSKEKKTTEQYHHKNMKLCHSNLKSLASRCPSSVVTCLPSSRSALLATSTAGTTDTRMHKRDVTIKQQDHTMARSLELSCQHSTYRGQDGTTKHGTRVCVYVRVRLQLLYIDCFLSLVQS